MNKLRKLYFNVDEMYMRGLKNEIETVAQPLLKENAKHFCRFQGDSNVSYPLRYGAFGAT